LRALQGVAAAIALASGCAALAQEFDGHARELALLLQRMIQNETYYSFYNAVPK
jgi:hypothetical protein